MSWGDIGKDNTKVLPDTFVRLGQGSTQLEANSAMSAKDSGQARHSVPALPQSSSERWSNYPSEDIGQKIMWDEKSIPRQSQWVLGFTFRPFSSQSSERTCKWEDVASNCIFKDSETRDILSTFKKNFRKRHDPLTWATNFTLAINSLSPANTPSLCIIPSGVQKCPCSLKTFI